MYRTCVQIGKSHTIICEGTYEYCLEAYNTYTNISRTGIVYIQMRVKVNTLDSAVYNYSWRGMNKERAL